MRKGDRTRQAILEHSAALFNQHGFAGTSLSDVMRATGLEKGGIYRHFVSKDELALEAFDHAYGQLRRHYLHALRGKRNAIDRLNALVRVFGSLAEGAPLAGGCPIMNTAIDSDDTHPELLLRARSAMDEWMTLLCSILQAGISKGEIRPGTDPDDYAAQIIARLEGSLMLSRLFDDSAFIDHARAELMAIFDRDLRMAHS
jgi:TetR/AcrR family transcriptional repressor of nem operon